MRLLFVGDVVGRPGREILARGLPRLRAEHDVDLTVVNGENSAGGTGITEKTAGEIFAAGADVITTGNHVWDKREVEAYIATEPRLLRPANDEGKPGAGSIVVTARDGTRVGIANLLGRVFMNDVADPFRSADAIVAELAEQSSVLFIDFHAEATSEKVALAWYLDGRVSAVVGTHTHVTTADERILPGGTAFLSDVGMTGPHESVIGVDVQSVLRRFLERRSVRMHVAQGDLRISAVVIEIDPEGGRARSIRRVSFRDDEASS